jgi:acetyl esterase/lipase
LLKRVKISERPVQGFRCMTVSPLEDGPRVTASKTRALYIHGGSYVSEILPAHWEFVARIVEQTGCTIDVPVYGLAPEHTYREGYALISQIWKELAATTDRSHLILLGDSAGAGFALGFAQTLLATPQWMPREILLISPWLDLTLTHPDIPTVQPRDPWLSTPGLIESGRQWSGGDDRKNPQLSPIHGPVRGLGRVLIFVGSREIMLPDCLSLRDRARRDGVEIDLVLGQGMVHVWPLLPIRQAHAPIAQMAARIKDSGRYPHPKSTNQ